MASKRSTWLALGGLTAVVALLLLNSYSVLATSGSLPAGTNISVTIDDPVPDTEFLAAGPGGTVDVTVSGTASVAAGVAVKDTAVVYIVDISDSMNDTAGANCDGVAGDDSRLVCEKEAVVAANTVAKTATSAIGQTGLGSFEGNFQDQICISTAHDVDLGAATQLLVAPDHDGNSNSTADVEEVAQGLTTGGATCYIGGLQRADEILGSSTSALNLVFFMSDGLNNTGANVNTFSPSNFGSNTRVHAFAMGEPGVVDCATDNFGKGNLNDVASQSTLQELPDLPPSGPGTCEQATDLSQIADKILESLGSTLESLEIQVDGGAFTPIPASDIDIALPADGGFDPKNANYSTTVADLGVGDHTICVRATGTDAGGTDSVTECETIHILAISLAPDGVVNELGVASPQTHTVTATIYGDPSQVGGRLVNFSVIAGPNAGAAGAAATDASGQASFTYTATQGLAGLGTDTIQACFTLNDPTGETGCDEVTKIWVDTTPPEVACAETVNPHGKTVPPAGSTTLPGPNGGQNEDGFYQLQAEDAVDPNPEIFVVDTGSGTIFGPFSNGDNIKYTEASATPGSKPMGSSIGEAGAITAHIIGNGDAVIFAVDAAGNVSATVSCLVPKPPK
jgi:hypothetical protein